MSVHEQLTYLRGRLHNTIKRELGASQVLPVLAQLMHGDDIGNVPVMAALDAYQQFLKEHWRELYPNMGGNDEPSK